MLNKIWSIKFDSMEKYISSRRPFGLQSNVVGKENRMTHGIKLISKGGKVGYVPKYDDRLTNMHNLDKWKVAIPKAIGNAHINDKTPKVIIVEPGAIVTETFLVRFIQY